MTPSRYFVARVAQAFGLFRRPVRMADAASEMHLLREAEAILGVAVWEKIEGIEALSVEYWNLRKLVKEREEVQVRLVACQERLNQAHEERAALLNSTPEANQELFDDKAALLAELESLAPRRDLIVAEAREVRRAYIGLKMKLEVLTNESEAGESHAGEIERAKERLVELKKRFAELKQERIDVGAMLEEGDEKLKAIDDKVREQRKQLRAQAAEAFKVIGEGNKEISLLRAESEVIDTRMRLLYGEIGRYVSRHAPHDAACAAAAASHRGLVDVMRAIRRSIALNHRLAGNA